MRRERNIRKFWIKRVYQSLTPQVNKVRQDQRYRTSFSRKWLMQLTHSFSEYVFFSPDFRSGKVWKPLTRLKDSSPWETCTFALLRCLFSNKNVYLFFPCKVYYPLIHSFSGAEKIKTVGKKNHIFHSLTRKCRFFNFSWTKNTVPLAGLFARTQSESYTFIWLRIRFGAEKA